jgi:hypothetical protein
MGLAQGQSTHFAHPPLEKRLQCFKTKPVPLRGVRDEDGLTRRPELERPKRAAS